MKTLEIANKLTKDHRRKIDKFFKKGNLGKKKSVFKNVTKRDLVKIRVTSKKIFQEDIMLQMSTKRKYAEY